MQNLEIFLKALELCFDGKRGIYIQKKTSIPLRFPAYKQIVLEVWCVNGDYKTLISKVDTIKKITTPEEQLEVDNLLTLESIKNILKYYGI